MTHVITIPIETDPDALAQEAFDNLAISIPGWTPPAGGLATFIIEESARMAAEARDVASDVPIAIFRWYGASVMGIPPIDAIHATVTSTWTLTDTLGHTIRAGTQVLIPKGDEQVAFVTVSDVTVAAGASATAAGAVQLVAVDAGAGANGLSGTPELYDALTFVQSIALVGSTSGGVDAESDDAYLDRLAAELQLMAPRPILPRDFEVFARRIAGVERALAIDGLAADGVTYNQERTVAVVLVDAAGEPVTAAVKTAVDADLQARREVSFVVHVLDPTYTTVKVSFTARCHTSWDPTDVQARAVTAVQDYLSPAKWGLPTTGDQRLWVNATKVRRLELAALLDRVEGLDYVETLTLAAGAGALDVLDVTLAGAAPLPRAGAITGSVTAP